MDQTQSEFLAKAVPGAISCMRVWGVPASITLAQAILESGWGQSRLATLCNNYFGIKAAVGADPGSYQEFPTEEFVDGRLAKEKAAFARYPSAEISFAAHALLLANANRYKLAMAVKSDPSKFAAELQACGYSTNPNYAQTLMNLVKQFDLTQYDVQPATPADAPAKGVQA